MGLMSHTPVYSLALSIISTNTLSTSNDCHAAFVLLFLTQATPTRRPTASAPARSTTLPLMPALAMPSPFMTLPATPLLSTRPRGRPLSIFPSKRLSSRGFATPLGGKVEPGFCPMTPMAGESGGEQVRATPPQCRTIILLTPLFSL